MTGLWALWWVWIVAALIFGIVEVFVPAFFFLGMAIAAVLIGAGMGVGVLGLIGVSLPVLLFVFAAVSLVATVLLRRWIGVRRGQVKIWHTDIND